jgi:hypothetical protein
MSEKKKLEARIMNAAKGGLPSLNYLTSTYYKRYGLDEMAKLSDRIVAIPAPGEFGFHLDLGKGKKSGGKVTKMRGGGLARTGVGSLSGYKVR